MEEGKEEANLESVYGAPEILREMGSIQARSTYLNIKFLKETYGPHWMDAKFTVQIATPMREGASEEETFWRLCLSGLNVLETCPQHEGHTYMSHFLLIKQRYPRYYQKIVDSRYVIPFDEEVDQASM